MPQCIKIQSKKQQVCIGDMTNRVTLNVRSITPETSNNDYDLDFTEVVTDWAAHESVSGETIFDEYNQENDVTDKFYMRYIPNVTFENWLEFEGRRYKIIDVTDIDLRHEFLMFRCNLKGSDLYNVTKA